MPKKKRRGGGLQMKAKQQKHQSNVTAAPAAPETGPSGGDSVAPATATDQETTQTAPDEATAQATSAGETATPTEQEQATNKASTEEEVDLFLQEKNPLFNPTKVDEMKRMAVALAFVHGYGCPDEDAWEYGMMKNLKEMFGYHKGTDIKPLLRDIIYCNNNGLQYSSAYKYAPTSNQSIISDLNGVEAQMIADCKEDGHSLRQTVNVLNAHCKDKGDDTEYTVSAISSAIKKLQPRVGRLKSRSSGSTDTTKPWCRASYGWATQQLVRFGYLVASDKLKDKDTGVVPDWYDIQKMQAISVDQCAWFDECHKKCHIGDATAEGTNHEYLVFPRDASGKIDLINGEYAKEDKILMKVKYSKEARFCFGCAVVTRTQDPSTRIGLRCNPFDYSEKLLLSIKEYESRRRTEINRVKALVGTRGGWVKDTRPEGQVYQDDPVTILKGCAKKTEEKLKEFQIMTVGDLKNVDAAIKQQLENTPRLPLKKLMQQASNCSEESKPEVQDYRASDNPYQARYGDEWEEKIGATCFMSAYVCVTHLVEWIVSSCKEMFKGTTHEEDWVFYHDALSQLTAKETINWMKAKGYYDRWIHPVNELHQDQPDLKVYWGRPVGDRPENMPWDNNLNQDAHLMVSHHVMFTSSYEEDDERKFSLSTPKRASYAYRRILDPDTGIAPSSERILHDVDLVFVNLMKIHEAEGSKLNLTSRPGRRFASSDVENRGGKRTKKQWKDMQLHPHAIQGRQVKIEESRERFEGVGEDEMGDE
jgi:hypothetical protein